MLPVLAEVGRLEKTVEYFLDTFKAKSSLTLVLITTEAEYKYQPSGLNTVDVCVALANKFSGKVIHRHYPKTDGRMSHQLNFAIHDLAMDGDDLIAVYNADSKPHRDTFRWVSKQRSRDSSLHVFQQYGDYTQNISERTNPILFSAALWQNRWAVGFELFKAIRSLRVARSDSIRRPLNYVIGHGLFITRDLYDRSIGFSEVFHNEDAILGLELSYLKEKITPIPFFDFSDTPDTVKSLYTQKIHWFFGPYQAPEYFLYLKAKYKTGSWREKTILACQAAKLFAHTIYWVMGPLLMLFLFVYPLISSNLFLLWTSFTIFIIFFVVPNYLSYVLFGGRKINVGTALTSLTLGGFVCYILHGLSALTAILVSIRRLLTGQSIAKGKTVMKK